VTENLRAAVARRSGTDADGEKQLSPVDLVKQQVRQNRAWFNTVVPAHVDGDQFVALCLGVINKGGDKLVQALVDNPHTFLQSASECARMGLVPGETFHFVPFRNKQGNGTWAYEITGIVDYKGEIDLIYRAGGVTAVHCHVVRAKDAFVWHPGQMEIPFHRIYQPEGATQEGLAGAEERGHLTGVYAYCVMASGGFSQPSVMGASEVRMHRAAAKTDKFWGPLWEPGDKPPEIRDTVAMWRKTAVHAQFDWVPHSAEYLAANLRAAAAIESRPAVTVAKPATEVTGGGDTPALTPAADDPASTPPATGGQEDDR